MLTELRKSLQVKIASMCTTYHLGATSEQNGDRLRVFAFLDDQHAVLGRAEAHLANQSSLGKFLKLMLD
jgi:hypothetical protein